MKMRTWPPWAIWLLQVVVLAGIYFVMARLGLLMAFAGTNASPVWPPTGVALAAVLLLGYRVWPGILVGEVLANAAAFSESGIPLATSIPVSTMFGAGNSLEAVAGAFLIRRFVVGQNSLDRVQNVFQFIVFGAMLAPTISATAGVTSLGLSGIAGWSEFVYIWATWWIGNAMGVLVITPLLLVWTRPGGFNRQIQRLAEGGLILGVLTLVLVLIFGMPFHTSSVLSYHLEYLVIPLIFWATFRFGPRGSTLAVLITTAIAVWYTVQGLGPFVMASTNDSLLLLQTYLAVIAVSALVLAAVLAEREQVKADLQQHQLHLEEMVAKRTAELVTVNKKLEQEVAERLWTEAVLREREERFKGLVERSFDAIVAVDLDGRITYVSPSVERVTGYSSDEGMGLHFEKFVAQSDLSMVSRMFQSVLQGESIEATEVKLVAKDGTSLFVDLNASPVVNQEGKIIGAQAVFRDITQRKMAEETLRRSEANLITAQRIAQVGNWEWSLPADELYWSEELYRIFDMEPATPPTQELAISMIHPDDRDLFQRAVNEAVFERNPLSIDFRIVRPDDSIRYVHNEAELVLDEAGKPVRIYGTVQDITERKQVEEALRQRNRELDRLNQAGRALTSTLDLDQVLSTVVEEVRRLPDVLACSVWLIDQETQELVCRKVTDPHAQIVEGWRIAPGQGLVGWVAEHGQSLNVPDINADERHFKGVDEQTGLKLRSILSVPLRIKQKIIGVIQVVDEAPSRFDQTHQTLVESLASTAAIAIQNAQWYEQARQDAETKLALFHEVNHRVKNNLTAIIGLLYAERHHAATEGRTYKDLINTLINRVQGLATVHELLSAAEWRPLPVSDLARQIIDAALHILSSSRHITVEVVPSPIKIAPAQASQLALVVNELATNTMKYALGERDQARIEVQVTEVDESLCVEFRDDGPGYPDDVLRRERHNVGLYLIETIVKSGLHGELDLRNDGGAVTKICFKLMP